MAQCRATCKATHQQCRRRAVTGRAVCVVHGGKTPIGAAHPRATRGGRYSRHPLERLAARFAEGEPLRELVTLHEELALVDARIGDLLGRLGTGESGAAWLSLRRIVAEMDRELARGGPRKDRQAIEAAAVARMAGVMAEASQAGGRGERAGWADVFRWVELRRKLALTEAQRLKQDREMIPADRLMELLGVILAVIREVVTDRETLARISAGFLAVLNQQDTPRLDQGSP